MNSKEYLDQSIQKESEKKQESTFSFEEPEYFKEYPIISREILTIGGYPIEFINQNPNVRLDQEHLLQAQEVLEKIYWHDRKLEKTHKKTFR